MIVSYSIDEADFLIHQLFIASKSDRIKKKRQRSKIMVSLVYAVLGFLFFLETKYSLSITFFIVGLLWFFIYPVWEKHYYIKHYRNFIQENYRDRIERIATLEIDNTFILIRDSGSESKISITEIEQLFEIPTAVFIRLKGSQSIILPKDKIANFPALRLRLEALATDLKIKYNMEEKWEWK